MRRSVFLSLLVLYLMLQSFATATATATVEESCKAITVVDNNFCVTSLKADPRSGSADTHGLALIAVNLTIANGTSTVSRINELLKNASDPSSKSGLEACLIVYSTALSDLRWAADAIASKHYDSAEEMIISAEVASYCEDAFEENSSPLQKEDGDYSNLALVAQFITQSLK